ncbi:MAG: hypothetical protein LAO06_21325 [Acidobacteriia bacterium]|nr:hypothetical protein [Terriglobia bacterium]
MSRVQNYKCEVCGMQERDHSQWLLVSDQPRAHHIDILKWNDKLAEQPGICHLCCTQHLHMLVGAWMMPNAGIPEQPGERDATGDDGSSILGELKFDRACLSGGFDTDRDSMLAVLEAVEIVLKSSQIQEEEQAPVYDA